VPYYVQKPIARLGSVKSYFCPSRRTSSDSLNGSQEPVAIGGARGEKAIAQSGCALERGVVEIGDAVSSILVLGSTATLVMTIGDTTQVYVQGKVDESDIGKVYLGQPARIKVESFKDKTFLGKVTKIAPLGVEKDNVTTFEVRVSIDNPGGELKANMTANAEILLDEHKNVLTVPEQAIMYDNNRNATVEVPDSKQKTGRRKVSIQAGISNGTKTEILSGLNSGDTVILQQ